MRKEENEQVSYLAIDADGLEPLVSSPPLTTREKRLDFLAIRGSEERLARLLALDWFY